MFPILLYLYLFNTDSNLLRMRLLQSLVSKSNTKNKIFRIVFKRSKRTSQELSFYVCVITSFFFSQQIDKFYEKLAFHLNFAEDAVSQYVNPKIATNRSNRRITLKLRMNIVMSLVVDYYI